MHSGNSSRTLSARRAAVHAAELDLCRKNQSIPAHLHGSRRGSSESRRRAVTRAPEMVLMRGIEPPTY